MELTSQAINEAEFSMARRGYDPDQVDEFLEKLAVAVDKQNEALAEAREQAAMLERRVADAERKLDERPERVVDAGAGGPSEEEVSTRTAQLTAAAEAELETLQRTLVLAQKTADATIREAEEEARRMIAKAESDATAAQETTRARLLQEIGDLDADRAALTSDVDALNARLDEQRLNLRATIADLEKLLADPARLHAAPLPALSEVRAVDAPAAEAAPPEEPAGEAPAPEADDRAELDADLGDERHGADPDDHRSPAEPDDDDRAWARFGSDDDLDDAGPPTQPVLRLDELERSSPGNGDAEDAYLNELRKAMLDDRGAPDVDDAFSDAASRQRFGRRR
jgi:DivIVA domain-containing protein